MAGCLLPPGIQLSSHDAKSKARGITAAVVLSRAVCLDFDKEHTQSSSGLARTIQAERGLALGTCWRSGSCWPVISLWRCFLCNALCESDLLIVRSLNKFRSLVCVCAP